MTTLITGGTGLIGSALAGELVSRDEPVVCFDVEPARLPGDVPVTVGDVATYHDLTGAVEDHEPDRLVHLAAVIGSPTNRRPTRALQVNAVGTDNVFRVAREYDLDRVVWASTLGVYGPADAYPTDSVSETTVTPAAYNVYPESSFYRAIKQLNEYQSRMYAAEHGVDARAIRPSVVFGPGRDRSWVGRFVEDALGEGESTVERPPDAELSLVYAPDVATLFAEVLLADAPDHHVYNTGGNTVSARELADAVERQTGGTVRCEPDAPPKASPAVIENRRAREEFDFAVTPIEEAVADYVQRLR